MLDGLRPPRRQCRPLLVLLQKGAPKIAGLAHGGDGQIGRRRRAFAQAPACRAGLFLQRLRLARQGRPPCLALGLAAFHFPPAQLVGFFPTTGFHSAAAPPSVL